MNALVSSNANLGKKMPKTTQLLREKMTTQLLRNYLVIQTNDLFSIGGFLNIFA